MISFVMLTWNRKAFIKLLFSSFYVNKSADCKYEFLIIDNGSDDGTVELLEEYGLKDPNIRIWFNKRNKNLNSYKKIFNKSKGDYIILIDDDVIEFPFCFDKTMVDYINEFSDFGFMALDVIQNEYTNGAKPDINNYTSVTKNNMVVSEGPAGGWCAIFRGKDYRKIKFYFSLSKLDVQNGEDGKLSYLFAKKLNLRHGIIKDINCLHASGPYYSKKYNCLERDILKYSQVGLDNLVQLYKSYQEKDIN